MVILFRHIHQGKIANNCDIDEELGMVLEQYEREGSYTIIYAGLPREETHKTYTAEFEGAVHTELKRQVHIQQRADNNTRTLPLFEKYQYFTPGQSKPSLADGFQILTYI